MHFLSIRTGTREKIVARLWSDDSFPDTERKHVNDFRKIRPALGERPLLAAIHRSVVEKGDRFLAPFEQGDPVRRSSWAML
jgi:hypothetical protein